MVRWKSGSSFVMPKGSLLYSYSGYAFSHYESSFPTRDCIPIVRSGLYQLVIRIKGIRVCALHCIGEVTSIRIAFEVFRHGHHAFRESSFVTLAHGPRLLFLLPRHRKAISAAANQIPFCKSDAFL